MNGMYITATVYPHHFAAAIKKELENSGYVCPRCGANTVHTVDAPSNPLDGGTFRIIHGPLANTGHTGQGYFMTLCCRNVIGYWGVYTPTGQPYGQDEGAAIGRYGTIDVLWQVNDARVGTSVALREMGRGYSDPY